MHPAPPDPWPLLHSRFGDHPFFLGQPVVVRPTPASLVLRQGHLRRFGIVALMFTFGVGLTAAYWLPDADRESTDLIPTSVVRVLGPVIGLFLAGASVYALFDRRRVELDTRRGVLRLTFGRHPRTSVVELRTADCALSLEPIRGREDVSAALLLRAAGDVRPARLASARWRETLLPLFETLRPHFGPNAADHTVADGGHLPLTPMRVSADRGRSHAIRLDAAAGTATVRRAGMGLLAVFLTFLLGAGLLAIGTFFTSPHPFSPVPITFGVLLVLGTLYAHARRLTIDRRTGLTLPRHARTEGAFPTGRVAASDIAAVQLCSMRRAGEQLHVGHVPIQLRAYTSYQVNLVTARPHNGRIHLLSDSNRTRARHAAQALSEFLGKPLLDHRDAPESEPTSSPPERL